MANYVENGDSNDKVFKTEQELAVYLQTSPKDILLYTTEGDDFVYVVSKNLYDDLKVYGFRLDMCGKEYGVFMALASRMAQFHGPIMKEICVTNPFDFLILSIVTSEYFEDTVMEECMVALKDVVTKTIREYIDANGPIELAAYKASLRTSIFMSRVGMGNMNIQKKQAAGGIVLPNTKN